MEISPSEILKRYGGLHRTVHGAGYPVLNRIMTTCKELLTDRGYSNIEVTPDVLKSISKNEPVMKAEGVSLFIHSEDRVGVKFARMLCDNVETTSASWSPSMDLRHLQKKNVKKHASLFWQKICVTM